VCCAAGEECIEDRCLAACASGVRCGADLATCCGDGQVCVSAACVDPGDACTDSFDCPIGSFCEPTLGRCLPQFDPVTCETMPVFGDFEPVLEWSFTTSPTRADCVHAISPPVIVDLDGDTAPEIVVSTACASAWTTGVLRALHGDGSGEIWAADDAIRRVDSRNVIAAGDLDGDGTPEIVAVAESLRVIALRADGTLFWQSITEVGDPLTIPSNSGGGPTLADLDADGTPEIVLGGLVLDATGRRLFQVGSASREGSNGTYTGGISVVADIDLDGSPEIVTGRNVYRASGTLFWTAAGGYTDGYPAVANFDADPQAEVVIVSEGRVALFDGVTGALEWGPESLPGGGRGGPPTVADFDGDGLPEIGVAGAGSYSVYDPDGAMPVLWSSTTEDMSSNVTGSSVFDFEGDGAAEVVYGDECFMRVYSGRDGSVLLQIPSSSATIHEYPVVADVDADGRSEIVIVANNATASLRTQCASSSPGWSGARAGVFVYGDPRNQWVRTRRIWHQHAYHVTNVTATGTIPAAETPNWTVAGLNNYRQNVQGEGVFNAPDLRVLALEVSLRDCPTSATLRARITNEGSLGAAAGVNVAFYRGGTADPSALLGVVPTSIPLLPGGSTVVELTVALEGDPPYAFLAVVDDDGTGASAGAGAVTECDEDDNASGIADVSCDLLI
jgi:hypothetical protein